jgi:transposase InsO family protein
MGRASMGRVGSAVDNAMTESVFATLKTELIYRRARPTHHELEMEVFAYLEGLYNTRRRHPCSATLAPPRTRPCA